jgi:hypothetical protein
MGDERGTNGWYLLTLVHVSGKEAEDTEEETDGDVDEGEEG